MHFVQWYQPKVIADSFTTWTTASIKQVRYPIHRTLHETFGARRPSSVFFGNRFRSADCQKIQLPPGGSQGGLYEFALDFIKLQVPTAKPLSQAPWACQLSFALSSCTPPFGRLHLLNLSGALFSLPPLGEVPRSGKGGVVGSFELLPFIRQHPLSQPCRFRRAVKSASN